MSTVQSVSVELTLIVNVCSDQCETDEEMLEFAEENFGIEQIILSDESLYIEDFSIRTQKVY